ncbi:MAG: argininosuccinate lyase [Verrucomicrobia bacterium]|nr:argininosuccinate lyase [Verrucomicrobiota bacterium]MCF7708154.1 argininosuccinate lyase [Verrucomicrobiota bacterium]
MNKSDIVSRSGRFKEEMDKDVTAFTESVSFDKRLWRQDIRGSIAHAAMLKQVGLLSHDECNAIIGGLEQIGKEIESGEFEWKTALEDVHMNIEAELTRRVHAGAKLHTARSRNDQIALDLRLWVRDEIRTTLLNLRRLQSALIELAETRPDAIIPGYTHLQRAQPVWLAHHLLAYVEMFERDYQRFRESMERVNNCPLGSGAIAGTTLKIDRYQTAALLGFVDEEGHPKITQNSMDAVSDRDFIIEFCSNAAITAVHISRLAEDIILWSTAEFGFIRISDAFTTGSSLMPQKKNPDIAELSRGKSARVIGNLVSMLTLIKGLPMTYNRDLQEDKERLFDTADTINATLNITAQMLRHTDVISEKCRAAASDPALLATDIVDYMVRKGLPFRNAHHAVGALVDAAESKNIPLNQLSLEDFKSVAPEFEQDIFDCLNPESAMNNRNIPGCPGTDEVKKQLKHWRRALESDQT